ncbi:FecR domain-containing protein [Niabella pedocola]|uniref:FecR domain-containing protein n=1 Tax=Niabella pedocola TaxID=1752077 RepID=A0ABS8PZI1_9BACT|nr:FecR domain-containing protein [Niabella pedocola]MCD2425346.1 FecR domain-containing protein [Niabella pedocola]
MHFSENRFYELLYRKLAGEAGIGELKELEQLLQENPGFGLLHDQVLKPDPVAPVAETEAAYMAHYVKMMQAGAAPPKMPLVVSPRQSGSRRVKRVVRLAVAAVVILAIGTSLWMFNRKAGGWPSLKTVAATEHGSKSKLTLSDGSVVHLNTNSNLSYGAGFGRGTREVYLTGEAFFEVAHNPDIPFIVHTAEADIKVLGTVFNVRDYMDESKMETSLLKGSIELALATNKDRRIRLHPSDKVVIEKLSGTTADSRTVRLTNINVTDSVVLETSWLQNKLAFADKSFSEIALDLKHRFGLTVVFKNPEVEHYRYTGVFDDSNAADVLNVLQMIKPFQYKIKDAQVIIF